MAPSFGADDNLVAKQNGIGSLTLVDTQGRFVEACSSNTLNFEVIPPASTILQVNKGSSRILDLEKKEVFDRYEDRIGEIINGEVYQVWRNEILILDCLATPHLWTRLNNGYHGLLHDIGKVPYV
ncbi:hypothetical protein N9Y89_00840 [bacterium]|nr:hypothetical protein [bacterium]